MYCFFLFSLEGMFAENITKFIILKFNLQTACVLACCGGVGNGVDCVVVSYVVLPSL